MIDSSATKSLSLPSSVLFVRFSKIFIKTRQKKIGERYIYIFFENFETLKRPSQKYFFFWGLFDSFFLCPSSLFHSLLITRRRRSKQKREEGIDEYKRL